MLNNPKKLNREGAEGKKEISPRDVFFVLPFSPLIMIRVCFKAHLQFRFDSEFGCICGVGRQALK
jgi:hypothetical protein